MAALRNQVSGLRVIHQSEGRPDSKLAWLSAQTFEDLVAAAQAHNIDINTVAEDDVCEIFYTSGTSSRPKGVALTHRNVYLHALNAAAGSNAGNETAEMHSIPLFHANGWGIAHSLTMLGGKHVMLRSFNPSELFRLIQDERWNTSGPYPSWPRCWSIIRTGPDRTRYDLSSLKVATIVVVAPSATLIRYFVEALQCECYTGYGLTETSPLLATSKDKPELQLSGDARHVAQSLAGYAVAGVTLRIVDSCDRFLPEDGTSVGEVVAQSDGVMLGYWNQP